MTDQKCFIILDKYIFDPVNQKIEKNHFFLLSFGLYFC